MSYTLLAGGYRRSLATLRFTPPTCGSAGQLEVVSEADCPPNPSWVSLGPNGAYGASEEEEDATVFSFQDGRVSSSQPTDAAPCHIHHLEDGTAVVVSNYLGGSLTHLPLHSTGLLGEPSKLPLPFAYAGSKAPNAERQDSAHAHGIVEARGTLYAADLGSDRVYVVKRSGNEMEVCGWVQCEPGFGPRHCALSDDGSILYVLGELGHAVAAYAVPATPTSSKTATKALFTAPVLPDTVPAEYQKGVDGAELVLDAKHNALYASNRLERHASKLHADLPALPEQSGDTVCILLLSADGKTVERTEQVRTGCCCVRGMVPSPDGKYVIVAGQCNAQVEVYEVVGRGKWNKVAESKVEKITSFAWM